jgi:hypothetical protein
MEQLYQRLPDLAAWRGLAAPAAASDLLELVPDERSLLLSFVLDDEALLILALRRPAASAEAAPAATEPIYEAYVAPVKRRQPAEIAATLHQSMAADTSRWRKAASAVISLWPEPVTNLLAAASNVVIVPHDVWWRVPFDALPSGAGYLGERVHMVLAGSAATLSRAQRAAPSDAKEVAAIGTPVLTASRVERLRQVAPAWTLRTPDEASRELQAAAVDPDRTPTVLAGAGATEQAVRAALGRARVVHLAAPFRINAASPLFSSVLLTAPDAPPPAASGAANDAPVPAPRPAEVDPANDGALELREVMNASSAARLALLTDGAAISMRDSAAAADVVQWGWLAAGVPPC